MGDKGSDGSHLPGEAEIIAAGYSTEDGFMSIASINPIASATGARLLSSEYRTEYLRAALRDPRKQKLTGRAPPGLLRTWLDNADGILGAWSATVYAITKDDFWKQWSLLMSEFPE